MIRSATTETIAARTFWLSTVLDLVREVAIYPSVLVGQLSNWPMDTHNPALNGKICLSTKFQICNFHVKIFSDTCGPSENSTTNHLLLRCGASDGGTTKKIVHSLSKFLYF